MFDFGRFVYPKKTKRVHNRFNMYPNGQFRVHFVYICGSNSNLFIMKKALLIFAMIVACIGANAQNNDNPTEYNVDSLTYQQLMADYVSLNRQVMQFKTMQMSSICLGAGAGVLSVASVFISASDQGMSKIMLIAAGLAGAGSVVTSIIGYNKLKRDRLEVTPNGVVIKLTPKK